MEEMQREPVGLGTTSVPPLDTAASTCSVIQNVSVARTLDFDESFITYA